ncbi:MAG: hypothetical protein ACFFD4_14075 [Candidatus Odinarchaeota archaeon]
MSSHFEKEILITEQSVRSRRLVFLILLASNAIYVAVLAMMEFSSSLSPVSEESSYPTDSLTVVFALVSLGAVIIDYMIFIPKTRKIEEPYHRYVFHLIVFILGSELLGIHGFILGFIELMYDGSVNWGIVGAFIFAAIFHGGILYVTEINPALKACEIGKKIPAVREAVPREE